MFSFPKAKCWWVSQSRHRVFKPRHPHVRILLLKNIYSYFNTSAASIVQLGWEISLSLAQELISTDKNAFFLLHKLLSTSLFGFGNRLDQCFHFFFFFFFIYHNWSLITILWWFFTCIHTNQPWVYMCSPSWPPPSSSFPIPSLRAFPVHQPWAHSLIHPTWNGDLFHIW